VMGAGQGSPVYAGVMRSMRAVLNKEREGQDDYQQRQPPPQFAAIGADR
jgi:hypothetical protein